MSYLREHDEHTARGAGFSASVVEVASPLGILWVESCDECPILWVTCMHRRNTWNADGTVLTCDLCGVDGT